jgi:hypothetical protein
MWLLCPKITGHIKGVSGGRRGREQCGLGLCPSGAIAERQEEGKIMILSSVSLLY